MTVGRSAPDSPTVIPNHPSPVIPNRSEESKILATWGTLPSNGLPLRSILDSSSCAPRNDRRGRAPRNDRRGRRAPQDDGGGSVPRNDGGGRGVVPNRPSPVIPNRSEESKIPATWGTLPSNGLPLRSILDSSSCAPRNDSGGCAPRNDGGGSTPRNDGGGSTPRNDSGGALLGMMVGGALLRMTVGGRSSD